MLEPVRVSDRNRHLTDASAPRIAEAGERKRRIDAQHGEIGAGILSDDVRAQRTAVRKNDLWLDRAVHDVMVCQHETIRCKDDTRTGAVASTVNVDDGRTDDLDSADHRLGVGVEQLVVVVAAFFSGSRSVHV